jgi:hypothetical protein
METIQRGVHQRKLFSRLDVNTFTVAEAIIRFCDHGHLSNSTVAHFSHGNFEQASVFSVLDHWTVLKTLSAYFLVGGDVEQLVKGLMNYLAFIYAYITAQTLFRIVIAEAQEYDGDCVIVAIS